MPAGADGNGAPQSLQNAASGSWPALAQRVQTRMRPTGSRRKYWAANSALTMPVGTARMPQPSSIWNEASSRPSSVFGVMSPKPTVVIVTTAQYMPIGMLVKPFAGPSTTYINVPITSTTRITNDRKTKILRRLAASALPSALYSAM